MGLICNYFSTIYLLLLILKNYYLIFILLCRYFGLQNLLLTNCTTDPRTFITNQELKWPSFVLPFALILLYYLLIFESGLLLFVSVSLKYLNLSVTKMKNNVHFPKRKKLPFCFPSFIFSVMFHYPYVTKA